MFVTINDSQYNVLEFTAYRVLSTKEHPIGVEIHFVGGMKLIKDFDTEAEREEFISKLGSTYVELSNIFYNAMYFTAYYTEDVVLDSTSYNVVAHYNGPTKLVFKFETEAARNEFVEKLDAMSLGGMTQKDTFADFPQTGSPSGIYLAKDTGQMYFWDEVLKTYEKLGVSRKGGVYSYNNVINNTIGHISKINKADLVELVKPSVAFMDGSEVIGNNSVRGVITASDAETVTVRTITDLVIDSFVQVDTEADLPEHGADNVIYYIKDIDAFRIWDEANTSFIVKPIGVVITKENKDDPIILKKLTEEFRKFKNNQAYSVMLSMPIWGHTGHKITVPVSFYLINSSDLTASLISSYFYFNGTTSDQANRGLLYRVGVVLNKSGGDTVTSIGDLSSPSLDIAEGTSSGANYLLRMNNKRSYTPNNDYAPTPRIFVQQKIDALNSKAGAVVVDELPEDRMIKKYAETGNISGLDINGVLVQKILNNGDLKFPFNQAEEFILNQENQEKYGKYYMYLGKNDEEYHGSNLNRKVVGFMSNHPDVFKVSGSSVSFKGHYNADKPVYAIYMNYAHSTDSATFSAELIKSDITMIPVYTTQWNHSSVPKLTFRTNTDIYLDYSMPYAHVYTSADASTSIYIDINMPIINKFEDGLIAVSKLGSVRGYPVGTLFIFQEEIYQSYVDEDVCGATIKYKKVLSSSSDLCFEGNSNEWAALTETEKANYLVSIVEPIAETDDDIEALLQSIIKDIEPTETSDDITEDEAVVMLDNIIEGGE